MQLHSCFRQRCLNGSLCQQLSCLATSHTLHITHTHTSHTHTHTHTHAHTHTHTHHTHTHTHTHITHHTHTHITHHTHTSHTHTHTHTHYTSHTHTHITHTHTHHTHTHHTHIGIRRPQVWAYGRVLSWQREHARCNCSNKRTPMCCGSMVHTRP